MFFEQASGCRHCLNGNWPSVTSRNKGDVGSILSDFTYPSNWNQSKYNVCIKAYVKKQKKPHKIR